MVKDGPSNDNLDESVESSGLLTLDTVRGIKSFV
jgi:hypothetical protein